MQFVRRGILQVPVTGNGAPLSAAVGIAVPVVALIRVGAFPFNKAASAVAVVPHADIERLRSAY
jgi:hypothetical protein